MGTNFRFGKIANMGPWDFWAHPSGLGLSDDDLAVAENRAAADPASIERIQFAAMSASRALLARSVDDDSPFRKPS